VNRIAAALVAVSMLGVAACGSSPSPLSPSPLPASLLVPSADAHGGAQFLNGPQSLNVRSSPAASSIVIDRGELDLSSGGGRIAVSGTRGFSLTAGVSRSGGILQAFDTCFASNCDPGSTIPLEAAWSGTDLPATVTLNGTTYTQVGSFATVTAADLRFSGSLVAPAVTNRASQTATAPFVLTGQFVHADAGGQVVTETITGEGIAKVWLVNRDGGTGWSVGRVIYKFRH
jgi:hypothetical protein